MAHWAAGMHQLSLGNPIEALCGFEAAFGLALQGAVAARAAAGGGTPAPDAKPEAFVKPNGDFAVILYYGYAGIARHLLGDSTGTRQFEQACAAFAGTLKAPGDKDAAQDAEFGLDQLRWVERKFMAAGAGAATAR